MDPVLHIMFHILLLAICVLISQLHKLHHTLIVIGKKEISRYHTLFGLDVFFFSLWFFVPIEIVFWVLCDIFV